MRYQYSPVGTCSTNIEIELEEGTHIIKEVKFTNGCSGNTQGVAKLCVGRKAEEVIEILKGTRCGFRKTSCPDQLAKALEEAIANN